MSRVRAGARGRVEPWVVAADEPVLGKAERCERAGAALRRRRRHEPKRVQLEVLVLVHRLSGTSSETRSGLISRKAVRAQSHPFLPSSEHTC